ncbi:hypothetical protein BGZ96_011642 [Linnemannia gamsii]|uniref:Uncharacterized protein n=1 Tax=Linnemannia gamsii TaxID=64522 RepID=A0ABQ7JSE3_9FUNG|nr:hypothetical protein BGZ96_011642 [Linnemannia gamsii]
MHRAIILLLAVCTIGALALGDWQIEITNNAGKTVSVPISGRRYCICLTTTQTSKIKNTNGGVMRLFETDDCTGNFSGLAKGATRSNAQWVNSASVGEDGIPSAGPYQCDPAN